MTAIDEIAAERKRQIEKEGYNSAHDDEHTDGDIAMAAACYAAPALIFTKDERSNATIYGDPWPWDQKYDKRPFVGNTLRDPGKTSDKIRRELLVKAGALIVAEIDRLDRLGESRAEDADYRRSQRA